MIIKRIYTNNIDITKDLIIRFAIKNELRYIDIGSELHIENMIIYLYDKFNDNIFKSENIEFIEINYEINTLKKLELINTCLNDLKQKNEFQKINDEISNQNSKIDYFLKVKKKTYINESRKVKNIIKKRGIL